MLTPSPETYHSILGLRVVRRFADRPLSDEHLSHILEAARWTGSAKNLQLWSFIVIDDPAQKERLLEAGNFMTPVRNAPLAIALVSHPDGYAFDMGRVAQNIMLAAAAIGVGSCPVTMHKQNVAHETLNIPEGYQCRYAVALGYPDENAELAGRSAQRAAMPVGRKPLDELVHRNQFGQ